MCTLSNTCGMLSASDAEHSSIINLQRIVMKVSIVLLLILIVNSVMSLRTVMPLCHCLEQKSVTSDSSTMATLCTISRLRLNIISCLMENMYMYSQIPEHNSTSHLQCTFPGIWHRRDKCF